MFLGRFQGRGFSKLLHLNDRIHPELNFEQNYSERAGRSCYIQPYANNSYLVVPIQQCKYSPFAEFVANDVKVNRAYCRCKKTLQAAAFRSMLHYCYSLNPKSYGLRNVEEFNHPLANKKRRYEPVFRSSSVSLSAFRGA